ncbi:MAG: FlgD immunoglobulin-like domain containing protein [Vicinamibacterales bacterium]|nr:FlgD immunoglobulin-like domain containing protein [Vicinamibacterales bacterium]
MRRILIIAGLVLLVASSGWAATLYVPSVYTTIQAAVDAAAPGDVIQVAAGTYNEMISVGKALTLRGANAGIHPAVGTHPTEPVGVRGAETILSHNGLFALSPQADGITVDGFLFSGDGGRIIDTYVDADGFHLTNCIFDNGAQATSQGVIQFGGGSHTDLLIDFNLFQDKGEHTIYTGGGPFDRMSISWNKFNVEGESLFWTASPLSDGRIQGNEFDGRIGGVPGTGYCTVNAGQLGNVQILDNWAHDLAYSPFQVGIIGGTVAGNHIERIYPYPGYYGYCFQLWGGVWGTAVSNNVLVEDNIFEFNDIPGATLPIHGFDITGADVGVTGVDGTTIHLRNNTFLDGGIVATSMAVRHRGDPTKPADAIENWWGAASGPYHTTANPGGTGGRVGDYVAFDPWWANAGMTVPGSNLPVHNVTRGLYYASIQAAINAANAGDVIVVAAGIYNEGLSIGKSVTILGPNAALSPNTATQVAPAVLAPLGNTHAIEGLAANVALTVRGMNFDLTGTNNDYRFANLINQAGNTWTFEHNVFANARECINGNWYLTGALGVFNFNLLDNLFTGNIVSNGIALWGSGVSNVDIRDNVFKDNQGWALNLNNVHGSLTANLFTDTNLTGPQWYDDQSGMIIASTNNNLALTGNTFSNLATSGVNIYDGFDGVLTGTGNSFINCATAGVRVRPGVPSDLSEVAFNGNTFTGNTVGVQNTGGPVLNALNNWWGSASGPYHATTNQGGTGDPVTDNVNYRPWTGMASVSALPAVSGPINCGQTVTLNFRYVPDALSPALRGFTVTVDCSDQLTFGAADIVDLGVFDAFDDDYFFPINNGNGTFTIDSAILGGSTGLTTAADLFRITFHPAGDGVGTVTLPTVVLRDLNNGDIGCVVAGATITVDCTPPPAVTNLTTAPGHQKVTLAWTMPVATDVHHFEVWRGVWHTGDNVTSAYPEYDDLTGDKEPTPPANHAAVLLNPEWTLINGVLPNTAVGYVDSYAPRGIYYYEVYAVDAAGNFGPGSSPDNRATNYWLGDFNVPWDGYVNVLDLDQFGASYGYSDANPLHYNNHCDVGPTDNRSGRGIPLTDSTVGFEDLMIFAQNFGTVGPTRQPAGGTDSPQLVWQRIDASTWALLLAEPCADLKGLHLTASLPEGVTCSVTSGSLLDGQSNPGFAANAPGNGLDAGLALLGQGATIGGAGELLRVVFSADVELQPRVTARDGANEDLAVSMTTEITPVTPLHFAAHQNYPNPFNPQTTIAFVLPEGREVRLAVYSLDGSLVRTLLDGALPAGPHTVVWDGLDNRGQGVATGAYFYRIEAGPDSQVRKMLLMK